MIYSFIQWVKMVGNSMNRAFFIFYSKPCCWYLSKDWCNVISTLTRKSYFMKECDVLKFDVSITSVENLEKFWFISKVVNKYFRIVSFLERNIFDQTDDLFICTWFLKNQVRRFGFLTCKNQFRDWFLQAKHVHRQ